MLKRDQRVSPTVRRVNSAGCIAMVKSPEKPATRQDGFMRVGAYKFREADEIGRGFSSRVYRAISSRQPNRVFAVKVVNLRKFKNLEMLDREVAISQKIDHKNIVRCLDTYRTQEHCYIVTEYCDGGDLSQHLKKHPLLSEKEAAEIIGQIVAGCLHLFRKGVLHRDLKPANVMKSGDCWKIGDFGFATYCSGDHMYDRVNVGTPLYMPPESLKLNKYSPKSEIFSLGIMLYQMLTGAMPWPSKTEKQLLGKMKTVAFPTFKAENTILQQFILKACEIDENTRIGPMELSQFHSALRQMHSPRVKVLERNKVMSQSISILMEPSCQLSARDIAPIQTPPTVRTANPQAGLVISLRKINPQIPKREKYLPGFKSQILIQSEKPDRTQPQRPQKTILTGTHLRSLGSEKILSRNGDCQSTEISQQAKHSSGFMSPVREQPSDQQTRSIFSHNTRALLNELQFCRLIYYLLKNKDYLVLDSQLSTLEGADEPLLGTKPQLMLLRLVLFKFLLRNIKQLEDAKQFMGSVLDPRTPDSFYRGKEYKAIAVEIRNYAKRYEKEYLDVLKSTDISIIRIVNRRFPQLSYTSSFGALFFSKLVEYLNSVSRACDRQLLALTTGLTAEQGSVGNGNYQCLETLMLIGQVLTHKLMGLARKGVQSRIMRDLTKNIVLDYGRSRIDRQHYFQLRQQLPLS